MSMTAELDRIQPFSFPELPVRGQIVHLEHSWQAILGDHGYPAHAASVLGEMVVIAAMLAHSIKLDGSVALQTRGDGPLGTAMAECVDRATLRGILRLRANGPASLPANPLGSGKLAITLRPSAGTPYQGVVELCEGPFSASIENYFDRSEQLPTRIRVASNPRRAAGLLVQRLPSAPPVEAADAWHRVADRTAQVTDQALLGTPTETLLRTTYAREIIRLKPGRDLEFGCSCSRERAATALRALGREEAERLIAEQPTGRRCIEVSCEFCGARYEYDAIDARLLFEGPLAAGPPGPTH